MLNGCIVVGVSDTPNDEECATDAVQDRLSLLFHMGIEASGVRMMLELMGVQTINDVTPGLLDGAGVIRTHNLEALSQAALFVATDELCGVINLAAASYPSKTLFVSDMLTPFGMVWFADPIDDPANDPEYPAPIRAISWALSQPNDPLLTLVGRAKNKPVLTIIGYSDTKALSQKNTNLRHEPRIYPVLSVLWELETTGGGVLFGPELQEQANVMRSPYIKILMSFWTVMRQRLTESNPPKVKVMPGMVKYAKARNKKLNTDLLIVRMRERSTTTYTGDHGFNRPDWKNKWTVRAHFRKQYYPSTGEHKPKLILSYIKGPADLPLVGGERAFLPPEPKEWLAWND